MLTELIARNLDLQRLRNEGYDIDVVADHLVIRGVPYFNDGKEVKQGILVSTLELSGNQTVKPQQHVIMFAGDYPCRQDGQPIETIRHQATSQQIGEIQLQYSFSNKPEGGYADYYEKMTRYAAILSAPAEAVDPSVTARTFPPLPNSSPEGVFVYLDTASSRAGISALSDRLRPVRVAIIGLGGTGSYTLDLVAKTPVKEIHLFDRDGFQNHNAFRAPGAASLSDLERRLSKVAYYALKYSEMHRGIVAHETNISETNLTNLEGMDFVFICIDRNEPKRVMFDWLKAAGIPFIDVGMGVTLEGGKLRGTLRATTVTTEMSNHVSNRVSFVDRHEDAAYDRNIQIAELNALNAAMAVLKWKKLLGFYHDQKREHQSTFTIGMNKVLSEDILCE
jgi:hypothetical protein